MSDKEEPHIKTAEPGYPFAEQQLRQQTRAVYGGVSWPGKRPGFAVVLAMGREKHFDSYDVYLLDEFESEDIRALVRQCEALDYRYQPLRWLGNPYHNAADQFIREMNAQLDTRTDREGIIVGAYRPHRRFALTLSPILEMEHPYEYMLPVLKVLLDKDRRQLYLKTSKVLAYMGQIRPDEIPFMQFGEYPAIEALGFATAAIRREADNERHANMPRDRDTAESYTVKTAF